MDIFRRNVTYLAVSIFGRRFEMKIVLDVGSNFDNINDCFESAKKAKQLGAHAIKFQSFTSQDLYGFENVVKDGISPEWFASIAAVCKQENIEFMCSVFNPSLVSVLDPFVKTHKIASSEVKNKGLVAEIKKTKKPVYASTGGVPFDSLQRLVTTFGRDRLTLLYCVIDYPSRTHALVNIPNMRKKYNIDIGYSDHSLDIYEAPMSALRHGATVLEKHFKIRDFDSNDNAHALNLVQTMAMIDHLNTMSQEYKTASEINNSYAVTRRCVATKLIKIGDTLRYHDNYEHVRGSPDIRMAVRSCDDPDGQKAKRVIYVGEEIVRKDYKN